LGRLLGELLSQHLVHAFDEGLPRPDLLLPVPLAIRRQRQRGFNQAAMLGQWLSTALQLPRQDAWLQRVLDTPAQQQLDAATRKRNLRKAFALASESAVAGRHIALVDDVLTTGATAESLARLLNKAGAARVDVYCLARTPKPGD
jgi:ComF family protein